MPIAVAELSKARVCSRSLAEIACLNPVVGMDVCVVCCTVKSKGTSQEIQDKEGWKKHREREKEKEFRKEIPVGSWDFLLT